MVSYHKCLRRGLRYVGFPDRRQKVCRRTNDERFKAHYGVGAETVCAIANDNPGITFKHLLITLCWWKLYETEHVMAGRWDLHEEVIRGVVQMTTRRLAKRKKDKIVFGNFHKKQVYLGTIDNKHCRLQEPRTDPDSKWYSHKFNGPGVTYEVAVDIVKDRILSVNGPYPASCHDITIFRGGKTKTKKDKWDQNALYFKIPEGKRLIGDSGYLGEPDKVTTTLGGHSKEVKAFLARAKSRQETVFTRYNNFKILNDGFRHGKNGLKAKLKLHKSVFDAISVVIQYDLESGHPLFSM